MQALDDVLLVDNGLSGVLRPRDVIQGVSDLLSGAIGSPERILPSLPAIMRAIRVAISCKNPGVILFACSALRQLATGNKEVRTKTITCMLSFRRYGFLRFNPEISTKKTIHLVLSTVQT